MQLKKIVRYDTDTSELYKIRRMPEVSFLPKPCQPHTTNALCSDGHPNPNQRPDPNCAYAVHPTAADVALMNCSSSTSTAASLVTAIVSVDPYGDMAQGDVWQPPALGTLAASLQVQVPLTHLLHPCITSIQDQNFELLNPRRQHFRHQH
jgi:hypothetical protein